MSLSLHAKLLPTQLWITHTFCTVAFPSVSAPYMNGEWGVFACAFACLT